MQALELKLDISERWQPESEEWQCTGRLVAMQKYQRALDVLEGLIVVRMFELTKMNRSQTGEFFLCDVFICAQLYFSRLRNAKAHWQGPPGTISRNLHSA